MPLYDYRCTTCRTRDTRVAALDDHTALCTHCGGLMLRLDQDLFQPYFASSAGVPGGAGIPARTPFSPPFSKGGPGGILTPSPLAGEGWVEGEA